MHDLHPPPPPPQTPAAKVTGNRGSSSDAAAAMTPANKGSDPRRTYRPLVFHLLALQSAVKSPNCTPTFLSSCRSRSPGPCLTYERVVGGGAVSHLRGKRMLTQSILFINAACLCLCRRVLLLAAALWQHVLPPRCSALLHDPADDERMFES